MIDKARFLYLVANIDDPQTKAAIGYFTKETPTKNPLLKADPFLMDLFAQFDLLDIPISQVIKDGDNLKKNLEGTISQCLNLRRPISQAYFLFWSHLMDEKGKLRVNNNIVSIIAPHLYRSLFCLAFQFEGVLPIFAKCQDSPQIAYIAFPALQFIAKCIFAFPNDIGEDFIDVFLPICNTIKKHIGALMIMKPPLRFIHETLALGHSIASVLCTYSVSRQHSDQMIQFLVCTYESLTEHHILGPNSILEITEFSKALLQIKTSNISISDDIMKRIFRISNLLLDFVTESIEHDDAMKRIGEIAIHIQLIFSSSYLLPDSFRIFSFVKKCLQNSMTPPILNNSEIIFVPERLYETSLLEIIDIRTLGKDQYLGPFERPKMGVLINDSLTIEQSLLGAKKYIEELCSTHQSFFDEYVLHIIKYQREQYNPIFQLYLLSLLVKSNPLNLKKIFKDDDLIWRLIINDYSFSSDAIRSDNIFYKETRSLTYTLLHLSLTASDTNHIELINCMVKYISFGIPELFLENISLLERLSALFHTRIVRSIVSTSLVDTLIDYDLKCKQAILDNSVFMEYALVYRNHIFTFFLQLMSSIEFSRYFLSKIERINYLFSLLFEKQANPVGIKLLGYGISSSEDGIIFSKIILLFSEIQKTELSENHLIIVIQLINLIESAFCSSSNINCFIFQELDLLNIIANHINAFVNNPKSRIFRQDLMNSFLRLCFSFYRSTQSSIHYKLNTREIIDTLSQLTIDDVIFSTICSIIVNDQIVLPLATRKVLRNVSALKILYYSSFRTPKQCEALDFILSLLKGSIENSWRCYQSGFFSSIVNEIDHSTPPQVFEIIKCVGSYFFSAKELGMLFQKMKDGTEELLSTFLQISSDMIRLQQPYLFSHGFSIEGEPNRYINPVFTKLNKFTVSFSAFHSKPLSSSIIRISSLSDVFTLNIGQSFSLCIQSLTDSVFSNPKVLPTGKWHRYSFTLSTDSVLLSSDDNMIELRLPKGFKISSSMLTFELLLHSDITVEKLLIKQNDTEKSISFDHSVPFPVSFYDIIPLAGGPSSYLPFFERVNEFPQSSIILKNLARLFLVLCRKDETMFHDQLFFRSLSHLLHQIHPDKWDFEAVNDFLAILLLMKDEKSHTEFFTSFWMDFEYWKQFPKEFIHIGISTSLSSFFKNHESSYVASIDFVTLLVKFYRYFSNDHNPASFTNSMNVLVVLGCQGLSETDSSLLISSSINLQCPFVTEGLLMVIYNILQKKPDSIIGVLTEFKGVKPFINLLLSDNEQVCFWALHVSFMIYKMTQNKDSVLNPILSIVKTGLSINADKLLSVVLGFINDQVQWRFQSVPVVFSNSLPSKNFEFLPLFCSILQNASSKQAFHNIKILFDNIREFSESKDIVISNNTWVYWISYIGIGFEREEKAIQLIIEIMLHELKINRQKFDLGYYYSFILLIFSAIDGQFYEWIGRVLTAFIVDNSIDEMLRYIFIFFCIQPTFARQRKMPKGISINEYFLSVFPEKRPNISFKPSIELEYDSPVVIALLTKTISYLMANDMIWKTTKIEDNEHVSNVVFIALLICLLSKQKSSQAQQFILELIHLYDTAKPSDSDSKNALFYMYSHPSVSNSSRQILSVYIKTNYLADPSFLDLTANQVKTKVESQIACIIPLFYSSIFLQIDRHLTIYRNHYGIVKPINISSKTFVHAQSIVSEALEQETLRDEQVHIQNERAWNALRAKITENGGVWSKPQSDHQLKLDPTLDKTGRRYRLKKNRHFQSHSDASIARDSGQIEACSPLPNSKPIVLREIGSPKQAFFSSECQMVSLSYNYTGIVHLFSSSITYQSNERISPFSQSKICKRTFIEIQRDEIMFILKRNYAHESVACEVFTKSMVSYFFVFPGSMRDSFLKRMKSNRIYIQNDSPSRVLKDFKIVEMWRNGQISNYEYLYWLNIISGRSFNDLTQYPIFPWILSDYTSKSIDLYDSSVYRDLSKPIGTLNHSRLNDIVNLFNEFDDPMMKCHFRIFYSNPGAIINFLIRVEPFTTLHIELQSGKFDITDRLFYSIPMTWNSVTGTGSDFRELIPEFFSLDSFLTNMNGFDLGKTANDKRIDDVILPNWATTPSDFIRINRDALESPISSSMLNEWVDLIFGYKQRGQPAIEAINDFHPFSYHESLENPLFSDFRQSILNHALNFGVSPMQLFIEKSPQRNLSFFIPRFSCSNFVEENIIGGVVSITSHNNKLVCILSSCEIVRFKYSKGVFKQTHSVEFDQRFSEHFANTFCISNYSNYNASENYFILSSPWSHQFTLFHISDTKATELFISSPHPSVINSVALDACRYPISSDLRVSMCSVSTDSSMLIYHRNYYGNECVSSSRLSSIVHSKPIIDVSICIDLDLIASIDGDLLILSSLRTASFLSSARLIGEPKNVLITKNGNIIVSTQIFDQKSTPKTLLSCYGMRCNLVSTVEMNSIIVFQSTITIHSYSEFLVTGYENRTISFIKIPFPADAQQIDTPCLFLSASYISENKTIFFAGENGKIYSFHLK